MNNEEPAKLKVRADPHRVMAWVDRALQERPFQLAATGLLVLTLAILLGPRLWQRDRIQLTAGDRAGSNIKATRNFDHMPSDESLEKARAAAVERILPVFDDQADLGTIIVSRIGRGFASMVSQDAGDPPETQILDPTTGRIEVAPPTPTPRAKPKARPVAAAPSPAGAPEDWEQKRKQFNEILQVELSQGDFEILRKARFSAELRASLQVIVGSAMTQLIISNRGILQPYQGKGILVRHLVGGQLGRGGEEKIVIFARIKDLQQVNEEIRIQSSVHAAKLSPELAQVIVILAQKLVVPNLSYNRGESDARRSAAREKIQPRPISLVKGQVIIRDGDPVTKEHLAIVSAMESTISGSNVLLEIVGVGIFALLLMAVVFRLARHQFQRFYQRPRDLLVMGVLVVGLVALAKGMVALGGGVRGQEIHYSNYLIPVAAGAMLTRLLIGAEAAALFSIIVSTLCGLLVDRNLGMMVFYLVTSLVGATGVAQVQSRSTILRAGLWSGLAGAGLVLGICMFQGQIASVDAISSILGAAGGPLLAAFMALALLPAMEWLFAYTTDVTLLELANLNHPLLRDLILRAPGTYHHSMVVGNLSETACESIQANGLLARVASYYHDIGKVKNSLYFAENFKPGENPHNRLKPSMSALIIRSHVKDTVEMLREHGVPELVIETATQHHGKTLIEFFYHKAAEQKEEGEDVRDEDYRYPGPKPQSREAGVIMLADGVEAAARSLAEPSEDRLRAVVQRVINGKFTDGQLDHCDLTLRDLHMIAKSFLQVLRGIYHQRPTYPWQQQEKEKQQQEKQEKQEKQQRREEGKRDSTKLRTVERDGEPVEEQAGGKGKKGRPEITATKNGKKGKDSTRDGKKGRDPTAKDGREARADTTRDNGKTPGRKKRESAQFAKVEVASPPPDEQRDDKQHDAAADQPAGEGKGPGGVEPASAPEAPTESSQDIKRLGLS